MNILPYPRFIRSPTIKDKIGFSFCNHHWCFKTWTNFRCCLSWMSRSKCITIAVNKNKVLIYIITIEVLKSLSYIQVFLVFLLFKLLKLVSAIFHQICIFFTKWQPFKNYEKWFSLHLKSSFRSRDIQIFVIFTLPFHTFQIQKHKWKSNNLCCHELTCINLQM